MASATNDSNPFVLSSPPSSASHSPITSINIFERMEKNKKSTSSTFTFSLSYSPMSTTHTLHSRNGHSVNSISYNNPSPKKQSMSASDDLIIQFTIELIKTGKVTQLQEMIKETGIPQASEYYLLHYTTLFAKKLRPSPEFKEACKKMLEIFIEAGISVDELDENNTTSLYCASRNGCDEMVSALIALKANPQIADPEGNAPLHVASNVATVDLLLLHPFVNVNARNNKGETKLHLLCSSSTSTSLEILKRLLSLKPSSKSNKSKVLDIDAVDKNLNTGALILARYMYVCEREEKKEDLNFASEMLMLLLRAGASQELLDMQQRNIRFYAAVTPSVALALQMANSSSIKNSCCTIL